MERNIAGPVLVVVAYRPRPGKEDALLQLTREHVPILRGQGLATERPVQAMRAADGTIIEVFEWVSQEAIAAAHQNPEVQKLWVRYGEACEYVPLASIKECSEMFAGFAPIEL
jgi:quinol monooxygenase YgiN